MRLCNFYKGTSSVPSCLLTGLYSPSKWGLLFQERIRSLQTKLTPRRGANMIMTELFPLKMYPFTSTHCMLVDYSLVIYWTSQFVILGVTGLFCHFYSILGGKSCIQTMQALIRRHMVWRLIWVCTVCL